MRRLRNVFRREDGFTLIELLVVIAVLGILAAIGIPRLTGINNRARLTEAEQTLGSLANAMEMYHVDENNYDLDDDDDMPLTGSNSNSLTDYIDEDSLPEDWTFEFDCEDDTFTITATGDNNTANEGLEASIDESKEITTTH